MLLLSKMVGLKLKITRTIVPCLYLKDSRVVFKLRNTESMENEWNVVKITAISVDVNKLNKISKYYDGFVNYRKPRI